MIRPSSLLCSFSLLPVFVFLPGCGGGGSSQRDRLSLSGRNSDGLSISLSQQSAAIARGQGNRYTLTLKNNTSRTQSFFAFEDAQGFSPGDLTVSDQSDREVFSFVDLSTTLDGIELKPNQALTRTISVPASAFAQIGTYRARADFTNGFIGGDGSFDPLGPLEVRVR